MKVKIILLSAFMVFSMKLVAQNNIRNKTTTWHSDKSIELHSTADMNTQTTLITRSGKNIELSRADGSLTFIITGIEGEWSDPAIDGQVTYNVKYQEQPGIIIFKRSDDDFYCLIDFTGVAPQAMKQKILINSFE